MSGESGAPAGPGKGAAMWMMLILALTSALAADEMPPSRPLPDGVSVGAIRWDGHASVGSVGRVSEQCMALRPEYRERVPFYGAVSAEGTVTLASDAPGMMAREVAYARTAGLDYWAFVLYGDEAKPGTSEMAMELGLRQYLALEDRQGLRFAGIVSGHAMLEGLDVLMARLLRYFRDDHYMRTRDGRPLVYFFQAQELVPEAATWRPWFAELRRRSVEQGSGDPFIAGMCWRVEDGRKFLSELGGDAMSAYAIGMAGGRDGEPYALLAQRVEQHWDLVKRENVTYIPTAMTGNDNRPMLELPVPWMHEAQRESPEEYLRRYYAQGSPMEIARHVGAAMDFVAANPALCPAGTVLVYSWMENIEGGWLVPSLGEDGSADTARVDALGTEIRGRRQAAEAPSAATAR